jgi:hypothetical protein
MKTMGTDMQMILMSTHFNMGYLSKLLQTKKLLLARMASHLHLGAQSAYMSDIDWQLMGYIYVFA